MKQFKKILTFLSIGAVSAMAGTAVFARDNFPERPVTIIVPYPPGGGVGVFVQALAEGLRAQWKQSVIVDAKPGANEIVGATALIHAPADGYTIFASTEAAMVLNPLLFKKLPYDPKKQIVPVSILVSAPLVFTVPASSPANTLKQFVDMAKERSSINPVSYGSSGAGGTGHLPFVALAMDNQLTLTHAAYKGAAPLLQDLLGGYVEAGLLSIPVAEPLIKNGKLKGLAVSAEKPLGGLPKVPLFTDTGVKDINASFIIALSAPAGTPSKVIEEIGSASRKVLMSPEFQTKTLQPSGYLAVGSDAAAYAQYIRMELMSQGKRIQAANIRMDD